MPDQNDERLQLSLAANALDFLKRAIEETAAADGRSLKYAVLHLADGIELLLKARLSQEAWYLLFANIDTADRGSLSNGEFKSVELDATVERLDRLANVALPAKNMAILKSLRGLRNRIRHYTADVNINEANALLGKTLAFALSFCETELMEDIDREDLQIEELAFALRNVEHFVEERHAAPHLEDQYCIECPRCLVESLIIDGDDPRCPFCGYEIDAEDLAENASEGIVEECPECDRPALALWAAGDNGGWFCYGCAFEADVISHCVSCDAVMADADQVICENCWAAIVSKD